jgi:hypothetical protein
MWTEIKNERALEQALKLARGSYQRSILLGAEALSGSTLTGKAREYASRYHRSREALLARMTEAGVPWCERRGDHNRRVLVIG